MSNLDQGYTSKKRASSGRSSGGGRMGPSLETFVSKARKDEVEDFMIRTVKEGILDILGLEPTSDMAVKIREGLASEAKDKKMTKADMEAQVAAAWDGMQAFGNGGRERDLKEAAGMLIAALQSATKAREADNLDEGDWIDDLATLMIDGSSWGMEKHGALQYKKHVNIAVDNSGSTHMRETGFCSRTMNSVADNLQSVLFGAGYEFPSITWDKFSFNRIAKQHTGKAARLRRREEQQQRQLLQGTYVEDPLSKDARETNLSPLMQAMYENEEVLGLLDTPRLDIILTDGEWETQRDADDAGRWQRMRGSKVTTYVLNLCPETIGDIALPANFRVIPVNCIQEGSFGLKEVDREILRQTIMSIVVQESGNF